MAKTPEEMAKTKTPLKENEYVVLVCPKCEGTLIVRGSSTRIIWPVGYCQKCNVGMKVKNGDESCP